MLGIGGHHELPLPHAQQVVFAQQAVNPFGIHLPTLPPQFGCDPRPAVTGPLQGDPLDGIPQVHIAFRARLAARVEAVEAGAAHAAQLYHAFNRQSPVRLHFFLDFPVDRGLPLSASSIRCSSMRCKHPFKKSISSVCWPILRSSSAILPSLQRCFPLPGKTLPAPWRNSRRQRCSTLGLTSNARAASPIDTPCSSRRTAASVNPSARADAPIATPGSSRRTAAGLNYLVNCLRDKPMTQFSIRCKKRLI